MGDEQMVASVVALATAPVKGLRLQPREAVQLETIGAVDDRRFFLIDDRNKMVNGRRVRKLTAVVARYEHERSRLTVTFPDGAIVEDEVRLGEMVSTRFFTRELAAALVVGPWNDALSAYSGRNVRLVMLPTDMPGTDRGYGGTVSLMSRESVARLEKQAGHAVDSRRFRMLIEVDGIEAHAEDRWIRRRLRIGEATVQINGNVGRCIVTCLDPDTGKGDMPALELLRQYRDGLETTERLALGVFGQVLVPGTVRRGDPVLLID